MGKIVPSFLFFFATRILNFIVKPIDYWFKGKISRIVKQKPELNSFFTHVVYASGVGVVVVVFKKMYSKIILSISNFSI